MENLYPLKFEPIYKDYIWGGTNLKSKLNKKIPDDFAKCAESWEISTIDENVSVVTNGFLAGNNLQELIEIYMGDLVGDKIFEKFGDEFPLLIKLIDATDTLSIQVHPNNEIAKQRHHAYGKTEMWYIIDSEPDAKIITGFNKDITKEGYLKHLESNTLADILNAVQANRDDIFFIPAGRVHAIGKGVLLAEIQQTSDITYRIHDWGRVDKNGNPRELHTELALDVIDFKKPESLKFSKTDKENIDVDLVKSEFFTVNRLTFNQIIEKDYNHLDSFVVLLCIDGELFVNYGKNQKEKMAKGETILIPADLKEVSFEPINKATLLEIYIE